jgi:hypothetical protein
MGGDERDTSDIEYDRALRRRYQDWLIGRIADKERLPYRDVQGIWNAKKAEMRQFHGRDWTVLMRSGHSDHRRFYDEVVHELTGVDMQDYLGWDTMPYTFRQIPFATPAVIKETRKRWQDIALKASPNPVTTAARWRHFKDKHNILRGSHDDRDQWIQNEIMRIEDAQDAPTYSWRGEKHYDPESHYRKRALKALKMDMASPALRQAIWEYDQGPKGGTRPYSLADELSPWSNSEASPVVHQLLDRRLQPTMPDWDGFLPIRRDRGIYPQARPHHIMPAVPPEFGEAWHQSDFDDPAQPHEEEEAQPEEDYDEEVHADEEESDEEEERRDSSSDGMDDRPSPARRRTILRAAPRPPAKRRGGEGGGDVIESETETDTDQNPTREDEGGW